MSDLAWHTRGDAVTSIRDAMQDLVDDAEAGAAIDRRLELSLWLVSSIFGVAVIATGLLQGPLWLVALLSVILGFVLGKIVTYRRRRRGALVRAAHLKKHLGTPIAEATS